MINQAHRAEPAEAARPAPEAEPPTPAAEPPAADAVPETVGEGEQNTVVDLGRIAWLGTVLVCLIVVTILVLEGYFGYAAVTLAVAIAAFINLL
jgi:hypothetical protein